MQQAGLGPTRLFWYYGRMLHPSLCHGRMLSSLPALCGLSAAALSSLDNTERVPHVTDVQAGPGLLRGGFW